MPRFYCPLALTNGLVFDLPGACAHHVLVLRLRTGDEVELFNGEGGQYVARITQLEKKRVEVEVIHHQNRERELPFSISLAQALPEAGKMDWIIEKAVELGVTHVHPLAAQRCVTKMPSDRAAKKLAHWQGIVAAASEQCGRNRLAQISEVRDFKVFLAQEKSTPTILLSPRATQSLSTWAQQHPTPLPAVHFLIGPEGGFTDAEEELAIQHGAMLLRMGERILRTETAGLAAISILSAIWGGMN